MERQRPLLQTLDQDENDATDILPGWIADLRSTHPANVIERLGVGDEKNEDGVFVGAEGDYRSLDEMISLPLIKFQHSRTV